MMLMEQLLPHSVPNESQERDGEQILHSRSIGYLRVALCHESLSLVSAAQLAVLCASWLAPPTLVSSVRCVDSCLLVQPTMPNSPCPAAHSDPAPQSRSSDTANTG